MAGKTSIGTVWVNVKPSLDGVQNSIQKQIKGTGTNISNDLGKEITKSTAIGTAIGAVIVKGAELAIGKVRDLFSNALNTMDSVIRSQNALEQMGYDANTVADKLKQLRENANKTAAEVGDLSDGFMTLTASWKDMDLTANATQALSDAILSFGGTPDMVANAITQISQVDIDGPLDAQTWLSLRNSGLIPVLGTIARMNGMSLGEYKSALGQGELTTRDFINSLISLDQQGSESQKSLLEIAKSNAAATWSGSWAAASETISSSLADVMNGFWKSTGFGEKLLNIADKIAEKLPEWAEHVKEFVDWLNSSDVAAQALKTTLEAIALTTVVVGLKSIATTWLPKIVGFVKGLITPVNIVIGAVALLATIINKAVQETFGSWGNWWESVVISWNSMWNNMSKTFEEWGYLISVKWNEIWTGIVTFFGGIIDAITAPFRQAGEDLAFIINDIPNKIQQGWAGVTGFFGGIWASIKGVFSTVGAWFATVFTGAWDNIKKAFDKAGSFFSGIWNTMKGAFDGVWQLGQDIVKGLVKGIQDAAKWAGQKIQDFCNGALQGIKDFFGIHSPSRVMAQMGVYLDQGLVKGINSEADEVSKAMRNMSEDALSEMATLDDRLAGGLNTSMDFQSSFNTDTPSRVTQYNNFTISDGFDLKKASSDLGYAVSMA